MTDLAKLVVTLEAQTAKYMTQLDSANKRLAKFEKDQRTVLGSIDRGVSKFGNGVRNALGAIGIGFSLKAVIDATVEAEKQFALLENAVAATDGAAGRTADQLRDMAGDLQKLSTFDDEAIMGAQQLLLRFKAIQGVNFDRAVESTLDLATVMGTDLNSAAKLLGKALEDPVKGATQLARSGVVLGDEQKKLIKLFVEAGDKARAQDVILKALNSSYAGAAAAARNTLGGALTGLKNAFGDLLEAEDGMPGVVTSLNELTDLLNSPEMKEGFGILLGGLADAAAFAIKAVDKIVKFTQKSSEMIARFSGADDLSVEFWDDEELQKQLKKYDRDIAALYDKWRGAKWGLSEKDVKRLREYEAIQKRISDELKNRAMTAPADTPKPAKNRTGFSEDDIEMPAELEKVEVTAQRIADMSGFEKWLDQLDGMTKTALEKEIEFLDEFEANLDMLLSEGKITPETYAERWKEALDSVLKEIEPAGEKLGDSLLKQFKKANVFMEQAFRNTVDIMANFFENSFDGSFSNILKDFDRMVKSMIAQMMAAQFAKWLLGANGGGGGALSKGLSFVGGLLSRDSGGRGRKGQAYAIGSGAQPEVFVPDTSGEFIPAGAWMGGGGKVVQNIYTQERLTSRSARQLELDASRRLRTASRLGG